ncbi:hypothetical protein KW797_01405 [Candidatus Parcubacteria bacterium]|nr:hypothetical protein [Candidatus Parcubacteria bacterium]
MKSFLLICWYHFRVLLGLRCNHEIEFQHVQATELRTYDAVPHVCEWCGKRGSMYKGRFIPSL